MKPSYRSFPSCFLTCLLLQKPTPESPTPTGRSRFPARSTKKASADLAFIANQLPQSPSPFVLLPPVVAVRELTIAASLFLDTGAALLSLALQRETRLMIQRQRLPRFYDTWSR